MKATELQRVRDWAQEKIDAGDEPPWAWFRYMQLIETLDKIIAGMGTTLRVVDDNYHLEPPEVEMPM